MKRLNYTQRHSVAVATIAKRRSRKFDALKQKDGTGATVSSPYIPAQSSVCGVNAYLHKKEGMATCWKCGNFHKIESPPEMPLKKAKMGLGVKITRKITSGSRRSQKRR